MSQLATWDKGTLDARNPSTVMDVRKQCSQGAPVASLLFSVRVADDVEQWHQSRGQASHGLTKARRQLLTGNHRNVALNEL
jgi:hypothetical protein